MAHNNSNQSRKNSKRKNRKRNEEKGVLTECPLCGKLVRDISNAIAHKETREPVHFECVMKEIALTEEIKESQKLCYLGQGTFGVVSMKDRSGKDFTIHKKIIYEKHDEAIQWRKKISEDLKK